MILKIIFFWLGLVSAWVQPVQAQSPIYVYRTGESVSYSPTSDPNSSSCRLRIGSAMPAEMLGRENGMIHVRFEADAIKGCLWDQLKGRNIREGWIPEAQVSYGANNPADAIRTDSAAPRSAASGAPCPEPMNLGVGRENVNGIGALVNHLRSVEAGMKTDADIENYLKCYPHGNTRAANDYPVYRPVIDKVAEIFQADLGVGFVSVNKSLFKCLLRRESGFDSRTVSGTGAVGLGQHTDINIRHISNRLSQRGSWERQLWDQFFAAMSKTAEGKQLLSQCPQTAGGQPPTFNSKDDAKCPLNSMAASAIYNLQVQQALRRSSKLRDIDWKDDLTYQVAIGATYNLGDGAAAKAVDDLELGGWVDSIRNRSRNPNKRTEVAGHVEALRNCMQQGNWKPMHPGDQPKCQLPSAGTHGPARRVPTPPPRPRR
ncbi:MAG: transglycosylase SLT domain-containing protein [Bdellovibrio sp.]